MKSAARTKKKDTSPFHVSLRFKLALPVLILVVLMILILFWSTFRTVSSLVMERNESRLQAIAEVFAETVKVPLILRNQQVLLANIEWMAKRGDVLEVRVEDSEGVIVGGARPTYLSLPQEVVEKSFLGVSRISADTYIVAVPIRAHERQLGRVMILFSQQGFEQELREIFETRLLLAFIMAALLAILTSAVTWLAIRPLFNLKRTAEEILAGDLSARARVHSFDEIQDLGEAFNEMVSRLAKSLDNLRTRTEALEESEEKYRLIVENASDIIFTLTPNRRLILLNSGFSDCTREELLLDGFSLFLSLHTPESARKFEEAFKEVMENKEPVTNIALTHMNRGNQSEIFYLTNLTPVLDHEGNVKLIQGVMRDITGLKRIEVMKDSLIRDVAHELKTPTAKFEMVVTWFEKELRKTGGVEKYKHVLEILKNNTDRLMRTINSIMDLSKLESGMDRIVKVELNLNEVLDQVRQDMEPLCKRKKIELQTFLSHEPLIMEGDRDMLYRLFVNLIGNSVKFTPNGKIALRSERGPNQILVTVRDTGIGLDAQELQKIFERFYQKTASTAGIGVGLTISRDIAAFHQGKIWAESEGLGKGTVFKVEFPKA